MRKKVNQIKKFTIEKLLFLCFTTTIIVATLTLSRYQSTMAGTNNTEVAIPIITFSSDILSLKMSPTNNIQEYIFAVSNTEENAKSEVSMQYTLQVKTLNNLPLEFELYTYDEQIQGSENLFSNTGSITNNEITINCEGNEIHTYKLKILWQEDKKSYEFSNVIEYVQIILNSSQAD